MLSNSEPNALLIRKCNLESSSCEEFIDSGEEKWSGDDEKDGMIVLSDFNTQPTLESLLNNLTLDKPIIPICTPASSPHPTKNRDPTLRRSNSISWLSTAFRYEKSCDDNLVIDASSTDAKPIILYANKMKLIEKLTTVLGKKISLVSIIDLLLIRLQIYG